LETEFNLKGENHGQHYDNSAGRGTSFRDRALRADSTPPQARELGHLEMNLTRPARGFIALKPPAAFGIPENDS
jgi:hypothetical protein